MNDNLKNGLKFRMFNVIDDYNRELSPAFGIFIIFLYKKAYAAKANA